MKPIKRLPDAEFEVMRVLWHNDPPMSTNQIISCLGPDNKWKPQTVLTMLARLIEKGFLKTEKPGKERIYSPLIPHDDYLQSETGNFLDKLHKNSVLSLVKTLYEGEKLSDNEIAGLRAWLEEQGRGK
jgi:predicted transcriptional regulator